MPESAFEHHRALVSNFSPPISPAHTLPVRRQPRRRRRAHAQLRADRRVLRKDCRRLARLPQPAQRYVPPAPRVAPPPDTLRAQARARPTRPTTTAPRSASATPSPRTPTPPSAPRRLTSTSRTRSVASSRRSTRSSPTRSSSARSPTSGRTSPPWRRRHVVSSRPRLHVLTKSLLQVYNQQMRDQKVEYAALKEAYEKRTPAEIEAANIALADALTVRFRVPYATCPRMPLTPPLLAQKGKRKAARAQGQVHGARPRAGQGRRRRDGAQLRRLGRGR